MNLSLKNRVALSFIIVNLAVLILSFMVFYFLNAHNREIESITELTHKSEILAEQVRVSAMGILKHQRKLMIERGEDFRMTRASVLEVSESFIAQLQTLDSLYTDVEVKKHIAQMLTYLDSLKLVLAKLLPSYRDPAGMSTFGELSDRILETFSEFQNMQYEFGAQRDKKIQDLIAETKRRMMVTLIIGFLATIVLGLVVPRKIALPFKKIRDAVRELKDCNFDVSIYYNQNDEIGDIAQEMNQMIASFKEFEILRTERVSLELRKFDVLANAVKRPVLLASADNKLVYMNNTMYSLLGVGSEDVIGKDIKASLLPDSIREAFEEAIKKRAKIEDTSIQIYSKKADLEHADDLVDKAHETAQAQVLELDTSEAQDSKIVSPDLVFDGHASVTPIRGKTNAQDYYLMVLSLEALA